MAQSAVVAVMQRVPGVVAVELTALYRTYAADDEQVGLKQPLAAQLPQAGSDQVTAAELLLLDSRPVDLRLLP